MGRREPEVFVGLSQLPFLADRFFYACTYLLDVFTPELVREAEFVVIRRINLVKRTPGLPAGIPGSRGVIRFDEDPRRRRHTSKRPAQAPVSGPGPDRVRAQRTGLPVQLDVIVE